MGRNYYYTGASLPHISFGAAPPFSTEELLASCKVTLKSDDYEVLCDATIAVPENEEILTGISKQYWTWEKALRNALVNERSQQLDVEGKDFLVYGESVGGLDEIASSAIKKDSPLDAEMYLNKARWDYIDELSMGHILDFEYIVCYYLKLQLSERMSKFDEEKGFENYQKLYQEILESKDNPTDEEKI